MFSCEFCKISKNTIFTEDLRATASEETFLKARYFERRKKPLKSWLEFFLCIQSVFMDKIMKKKRGLEREKIYKKLNISRMKK